MPKRTTAEFADVADLAKLPYFELSEDGKYLKYTGRDSGFVDFHTHVGENFFLGKPVDWFVENETKTFFPFRGAPPDMEKYAAYSFSKKMVRKTRWETIRPIIANNGIGKTHTFANMYRELTYLGFARAVVLAVDVMGSKNSERMLGYKRMLEDKFTVYASVDPKMRTAKEKLLTHIKNGARGLKIHPMMQTISPGDRRVVELCRIAGEYRLPVIFHSGWGPLVPEWQKRYVEFADFEKLVRACPETTIIMGHAGSGGYKEAVRIADKHKNVYLELSGQTPAAIKEILTELGDDRLLFGSDWPYYPIAWPMAKVLLATEGKRKSREKIMKLNALKILRKETKPGQI